MSFLNTNKDLMDISSMTMGELLAAGATTFPQDLDADPIPPKIQITQEMLNSKMEEAGAPSKLPLADMQMRVVPYNQISIKKSSVVVFSFARLTQMRQQLTEVATSDANKRRIPLSQYVPNFKNPFQNWLWINYSKIVTDAQSTYKFHVYEGQPNGSLPDTSSIEIVGFWLLLPSKKIDASAFDATAAFPACQSSQKTSG